MTHPLAPIPQTHRLEAREPNTDEILERETQTARTAVGSSFIPISVDVRACDPIANSLPFIDETYEQYLHAASTALDNLETAFVTFDGLEQNPNHPNAFQFIRTAHSPEALVKCAPILRAPRADEDYAQAVPLVAGLKERGIRQIVVAGWDSSEQHGSYDASAEHDRIHLFLKAMRATKLFDKVGVIIRPNPDIANMNHPKSTPEEIVQLIGSSDFAIIRTAFTTKAYTDALKALSKTEIDTPIIPALEIREKTEDFKELERRVILSGIVIPWELDEELRKASLFEQAPLKEAWTIRLGRQLIGLGAPGIHIISNNQTRATQRIAQGIRQP